MATASAPATQGEGNTVSLGRLGSLKIMSVPVFVGVWAALGPGFVWASLGQGSGELIWWPYLTAKYGDAFLGILLPACIIQYWVNYEIIRYTVTTGETFFTGMCRLNKGFTILLWLMLVITFMWFGGYAAGGSTALFDLTKLPPGWSPRAGTLFWTYITMAIFLAALIFGRVIYNVVEKFMTVVVIITVVGLVIAVLNGTVLATAGSFFAAYLNPFAIFGGMSAKWDSKDADALLTGVAFAGMGGFFNVMYSYWVRDKGHCMSQYAGRVTSPITGKPEAIPATGFGFADTPENKRNYLDWLRFSRLDNGIAVGVNAITVMLMCWLAWAILLPKGEVPAGWKIAVTQAQFFENAMGAFGRMLFLVIAAAFLSDSWLGITDAVSRMHSDFFCHTVPGAQRISFRAWYYIFVGVLTFISATTVLMAQPGALLLAGGVLNFIAMAIYMPALIYLNHKMLPRVLPEWVRPAKATFWIASAITAFYIVLGIIYLLFKLFNVRILF